VPTPTSLRAIERAVRAAWGADVCEDPADVPRWSRANPSRGQCGPTALVLNDLLGGDLCVAEVRLPDGTQQGFHWWNRLAGVDVDLTREQFGPDELVEEPHVLPRPPGPPKRGEAQYLLLRARVLAALDATVRPPTLSASGG
jgi:hypothetical protein